MRPATRRAVRAAEQGIERVVESKASAAFTLANAESFQANGAYSSANASHSSASVAFGDGQVAHAQFVSALQSNGYTGPLVIEREVGDDRMADVAFAIETLQQIAGVPTQESLEGEEVAG